MGYSLRVAAAALALATVPLARAQDARPHSPVEGIVRNAQDPEVPIQRIPLYVPREAAPTVEQPKPAVQELTPEERFAMGMRALQVEWDAAWFTQAQQPNPAYHTVDPDLRVPHAGHAASLNDFFYAPFDDGTHDTENRVYDHDLGLAQDWVRHRLVAPFREHWKRATHQQYQHDELFGLVTRESFEPYFSDGVGLQWAKVWENGDGHRQKSRIRIQDLQDWQMGYFYERNNWRLATTAGMDEGEWEIRIGVRIDLDRNRSLERIAKRHRHGRSDSVHEVRTAAVPQPAAAPVYTPPQKVGMVARSTLGR